MTNKRDLRDHAKQLLERLRQEDKGHVTEEMQRHYSTVGLDEKRAAIKGVLRLVPPSPSTETTPEPTSTTEGGVSEVNLRIAS